MRVTGQRCTREHKLQRPFRSLHQGILCFPNLAQLKYSGEVAIYAFPNSGLLAILPRLPQSFQIPFQGFSRIGNCDLSRQDVVKLIRSAAPRSTLARFFHG